MVSAQKKKTSVASLDPDGTNVEVGDQVLVAGQKVGIVRFYGKTDFAPGEGSTGSGSSDICTLNMFWSEPGSGCPCRVLVRRRVGSAHWETRRFCVRRPILQLPAQIWRVCSAFPGPEVGSVLSLGD